MFTLENIAKLFGAIFVINLLIGIISFSEKVEDIGQ